MRETTMSDTPDPITITTRRADDGVVVSVAGELDLHSASALTDAVQRVLDEHPGETIALDASGLSFADSAGLRALLVAHGDAGERNVAFRIVRPSEPLERLLEMTGLREMLCAPG